MSLSPVAQATNQPIITPIDNNKYKTFSVTKQYFSDVTTSDCTMSSITAKVSLVVLPIMLALTLLADLIAALVNCVFGEKKIEQTENEFDGVSNLFKETVDATETPAQAAGSVPAAPPVAQDIALDVLADPTAPATAAIDAETPAQAADSAPIAPPASVLVEDAPTETPVSEDTSAPAPLPARGTHKPWGKGPVLVFKEIGESGHPDYFFLTNENEKRLVGVSQVELYKSI
jgi:hypothetical protein